MLAVAATPNAPPCALYGPVFGRARFPWCSVAVPAGGLCYTGRGSSPCIAHDFRFGSSADWPLSGRPPFGGVAVALALDSLAQKADGPTVVTHHRPAGKEARHLASGPRALPRGSHLRARVGVSAHTQALR